MNGSDRKTTLEEAFRKYCQLKLPSMEECTRLKLEKRMSSFLEPFFKEPMASLAPERIADLIALAKERQTKNPFSKRFSFHRELDDFKTICNWWIDHYDFQFRNPIRSFHYGLATLSEAPEKTKKISPEETVRFLSRIPEGIYRDMAITQFYTGGRIGEVAGIQIKNIDLRRRVLTIREVLIWVNGAPKVKRYPKNGEVREVYINNALMEIFKRRREQGREESIFLFHDRGKPLRYSRIHANFNKAWKAAGLHGKFSGSHLLRYSAAQVARQVTGSLDATAAITGHRSRAMAEKYGIQDTHKLNRSSVIQVEKFMSKYSDRLKNEGSDSENSPNHP